MKYIIFKAHDKTMAIVFPGYLIHKPIGEAIELQFGELISAGSLEDGKTVGFSESLGLFSRPEDAEIIAQEYKNQGEKCD